MDAVLAPAVPLFRDVAAGEVGNAGFAGLNAAGGEFPPVAVWKRSADRASSMIPKSGNRFSDKILLNGNRDHDPALPKDHGRE
jgi:hypothetical protein